jgi:DeoR/GlpR family transcriptional regulator of sugar metabolism
LRAVLNCGDHVILVTDSSKFHLSALAQLSPLTAVRTLVTDTNLDEDIAHQLREMEITLLTV